MTLRSQAGRRAAATLVLLGLVALAGPVRAATSSVSIVERSFQPNAITVIAGDSVTWTVTKGINEPHSVTSGTPGGDAGKVFDSGIKLVKDGDTFSQTFATPGEFAYFCSVHPSLMTGKITVLAAGSTLPPSAAPGAGEPGAESGIDPTSKLIAAAILGVVLILLFGSAWAYRRVNR